MAALFHYRAQRRRARAAAKADASRRRLITTALMVLIIGAFITCSYTLQREQQLQQQEQYRP